MRPLIYLELTQLINSIKNTVRSPRRLIPMLLAGAWVISWFFQSLVLFTGGASHGHASMALLAKLPVETVELIIFVLLSVGSVLVMYGAFSSGLMVFTIAHIDFLFPTPISRRSVLLVKLAKDYLKYSFWVTFLFLLVGTPVFAVFGASTVPWGLVSVAALVALLVTVVNVAHTINIVFTFGFERLKQAGMLIKGVLIGVPATAVVYGVYQYVVSGQGLESLMGALNSPIIGFAFAPAKWASRLFLAPLWNGVTPDEWGYFGLLWLMAIGSGALLLSRRENLYEPSLGVSAKFARHRKAVQSRSYADVRADAMLAKGQTRAHGARIRPFGLGASAFLWKNMVLRYRTYQSQLVLMLLLPLLIVYMANRFMPAEAARSLPLVLVYMVWVLSMAAQGEVRVDLKYANTVKSMPIAAWKLIMAQVVSSVMYLTGGALVFSLYLWAFLPACRGELLIACMLGIPFLGFATISAVTIPSILYPDTRDMAQNYLCGMFGFLLSAVAVGPTVILGSVLAFVLQAPIFVTLAVVSVCNLIMGMAGVSIAGIVFRRFDPTTE